jgi:hypothetical protein
MSTETPEVQDS